MRTSNFSFMTPAKIKDKLDDFDLLLSNLECSFIEEENNSTWELSPVESISILRQKNWELKREILEEEFLGNLYETVNLQRFEFFYAMYTREVVRLLRSKTFRCSPSQKAIVEFLLQLAD